MKDNYGIFTNKQLKNMIVPLFFEQLLVMLVGLADTFIITYAGEDAVSGVSLVNSFSVIFIYIFTALASGGAVVISQYIGKGDKALASEASSQLLMVSTLISVVITALVYFFDVALMRLLFGAVTDAVMDACLVYLRITAISFPTLAIYNAGASLFRSIGNTKITMIISTISNVINLVGNLVLVLVFKWGVAGVAWPTTISRLFSAVAITILCFNKKLDIFYTVKDIFKWNGKLLKQMLAIAVPNGVENGIFQLVKVALSSMVAMFGTYQIAANGVAQSIWSLAAVMGAALSPVFITVIGQCMGSGNKDAAVFYMKKLMVINVIASTVWNIIVLAITPVILNFNSLEQQTRDLILVLVIIHNIFNSVALPFSGSLSSGLRAAGDIKFTMIVAIASTIGGRLVLSYIFAVLMNMGVIGIAYAMCADWCIRGIIYHFRFRSMKWLEFKVI
jgi:putative MATE family efflux protein